MEGSPTRVIISSISISITGISRILTTACPVVEALLVADLGLTWLLEASLGLLETRVTWVTLIGAEPPCGLEAVAGSGG